MPAWLLPMAAIALSQAVQGWVSGRAEERQTALARAMAEEDRKAREKEAARAMAAQLVMAEYGEGQKRTASSRLKAMFVNGMANNFLVAPPPWLQFPTAGDINRRGQQLAPQAWNYEAKDIPNAPWWETAMAVGGAGLGAVGLGKAWQNIYGTPTGTPTGTTAQPQTRYGPAPPMKGWL